MTLRDGVTVLLIPRWQGRVALIRDAKGHSYMTSQFVHMPSLLVSCVNIHLMTWIQRRRSRLGDTDFSNVKSSLTIMRNKPQREGIRRKDSTR